MAYYALISNTNFISNSASTTQNGPAVYIIYDGTLVNSRLEQNQGGAAYIAFAVMTDTDFVNNTTTSSYDMQSGGLTSQKAAIFGGRFEHNIKRGYNNGGAVAALDTLYVRDTQFISNSADSGGAVWAHHANIENAYFQSNTANGLYYSIGGGGGAIFGEESLLVANSQFVSNTALYGGAILLSRTGPDPAIAAQAAITNSVFANNVAITDGATLFAGYRVSNQITLVNLTIADINLNDKSAIAVTDATLHITDSIIASHTIAINSTGGTVYEDYNLFFGNITNTVGVITGAHSLIGDPKFIDPFHDDYHLQAGSAAIDHGIDAGVYTDLDGNPRPIGAGFDIGAYEYQFAPSNYTLTVAMAGTGSGVVSPTAGIHQYLYGDVVTLTATPLISSTFTGWSGDVNGTSSPITLTMDADKSVTATFALKTFVITPTAGANGSITPATPQTVNYGASQTFTITLNIGYHIADVGVDGVSQGPLGLYAFTNITADHTISAAFAINTYIITPTTGANGSIAPSTPQTMNYGANQTFTITSNTGYHIVDVGVDGISQGPIGLYAFTNVTGSHTISAAFALNALNTYTLTVNYAGNGLGSVTLNPPGPSYTVGTLVTLTATPLITSTFTGWSGNVVTTTNPLIVTMDSNKTITATFALKQYGIYLPLITR